MANLYVPSRQSERYSIAIIGDCEVLRLGLYAALAKVAQTNQIIYLNIAIGIQTCFKIVVV